MKAVKEIFKNKPEKFYTTSQIALETSLSFEQIEHAISNLRKRYHYNVSVNARGELSYKFNFKKKFNSKISKLYTQLRQLLEVILTSFVFVIPVFVLSSFFYIIFSTPHVNYISIILYLITFILMFLTPWYLISLGAKIFFKNPHPVLKGLPSLFNFYTESKRTKTSKLRLIKYGISKYIRGQKPFDIDFYFTKKIVQYLKFNQFKITTAEVVKLTGYSLLKSEELIIKILNEFEGEISVDKKNGVVYYTFPYLNQNDINFSGRVKPIWSEFKKEYGFSNNPKFLNILIFSNLILTLFFSAVFLLGNTLGSVLTFTKFIVSFTPFIFSTICLGYYTFKKNIYNKSIRKFNDLVEKSKSLKYIFKNLPSVKPTWLNKKSIHDKHLDLDGKAIIEDTNLKFRFDRLKKELDFKDKNVA